ncbi:unnamed protein product [Pleuronectes platessa]|uniref:Uncharacterized protein n=1 Tax=Pleuronectes platessa TaxID=8262 RepID=A0A9N7U3S5_PLEPL|nr:unnamed protein product [Pleuronectes platessa]
MSLRVPQGVHGGHHAVLMERCASNRRWYQLNCGIRILAARRQSRRTAGGGSPRERRVPPAGAIAEVIREKGPTRVQSRRRRPPYPVPSNGPPSAPATDTAPRSKRKKAPRTTDARTGERCVHHTFCATLAVCQEAQRSQVVQWHRW